MARLSHADQSRFSVPRLYSRRSHRARSRLVPRLGEALFRLARPGNSRVAQLLLQISNDRAGIVSRARSLHSIDEAEKHAAAFKRRGTDHAPGTGVLRLSMVNGGSNKARDADDRGLIEGKMNPRYSDLRVPTEMHRQIPSLGDSLSRRTGDLHDAGTNLATGLPRLGMTTGSRVSFSSSISGGQRAGEWGGETVFFILSP